MSNFKNYQQQGLAGDVQFGKGGGRLVFADGVFSVVAAPTGADLGRLQVAAPSEPQDAVTLAAMTDAINQVYGKVDQNATSVSTQLASIQSAVSTIKLDTIASATMQAVVDTNLVLRKTTSDAVLKFSLENGYAMIKVTSGATLGADLVLVPQGNGSVVIGDGSEDGLIQPSAGHSLTIAGGDANAAGSVIIRGGQGTTPGHVEIHDLKDPVDSQDAVTLASSTSAIAAAVQTVISGSVRAIVGSFKEASGDTVIAAMPAGTILRLKVMIETPFSSGSAITVKTGSVTLALPAAIDEGQVGLYTVELLQSTAQDQLIVSMATTGTQGAASVALEYIAD